MSTSLANNSLLKGYCGLQSSAGSSIYVKIDGLTPFANYKIDSVCARNTVISNSEVAVYFNAEIPVSSDMSVTHPQDNIKTANAISDASGSLFIAIAEDGSDNYTIINGIRITNI
jgi:hypothetical protein